MFQLAARVARLCRGSPGGVVGAKDLTILAMLEILHKLGQNVPSADGRRTSVRFKPRPWHNPARC